MYTEIFQCGLRSTVTVAVYGICTVCTDTEAGGSTPHRVCLLAAAPDLDARGPVTGRLAAASSLGCRPGRAGNSRNRKHHYGTSRLHRRLVQGSNGATLDDIRATRLWVGDSRCFVCVGCSQPSMGGSRCPYVYMPGSSGQIDSTGRVKKQYDMQLVYVRPEQFLRL
jgi:hypothetical protein